MSNYRVEFTWKWRILLLGKNVDSKNLITQILFFLLGKTIFISARLSCFSDWPPERATWNHTTLITDTKHNNGIQLSAMKLTRLLLENVKYRRPSCLTSNELSRLFRMLFICFWGSNSYFNQQNSEKWWFVDTFWITHAVLALSAITNIWTSSEFNQNTSHELCRPIQQLNILYNFQRLTLKTDAECTLKGNQWPLSSYGPFRDKPCIPNFLEDQSFEEARHLCELQYFM